MPWYLLKKKEMPWLALHSEVMRREREREEEEEVGCLLEFAWNDNDGLVFSRENKGKK